MAELRAFRVIVLRWRETHIGRFFVELRRSREVLVEHFALEKHHAQRRNRIRIPLHFV